MMQVMLARYRATDVSNHTFCVATKINSPEDIAFIESMMRGRFVEWVR